MTWHDNTLAHDESDAIPTGWHEVPVQKLIVKHICGPSPDCDERPIQTEQEWGVLKTTAIVWKGWNESAHKTLPREYWGLEHLQVQQGDVLITKAGPRDRVAVVVHVTSKPRRIIVSGKMIALRPRPDAVVPQVLCGVLGLRRIQDYIHGRTTGMAESQVNFANGVVLDANVRVPVEIAEQSRIAEILDTLDAAIRETEAVVAKLRQVKAGLLHDLLTRGLDEHGQLRDPARHPDQFHDSPLGRIPKEWNVKTLNDIALLQRGKFTPRPRNDPRYFVGGTLPFAQTGDIAAANGEFLLKASQSLNANGAAVSKLFPAYTVAITIAANIGDTAIFGIPMYLTDSVVGAVVHEPNDARFLSMVLKRKKKVLQAIAPQSAQANINLEILRPLLIAAPQPEEQSAIADCYFSLLSRIASEELTLSKLHCLKRGLAHDLLTGRVRVKLEPQP